MDKSYLSKANFDNTILYYIFFEIFAFYIPYLFSFLRIYKYHSNRKNQNLVILKIVIYNYLLPLI